MLNFESDSQTLSDLGIFSKSGDNSIYSLFDFTSTVGGAEVLKQMFKQPISDDKLINGRISIFEFFASKHFHFPFRTELFDILESYLRNTDTRTTLSTEKNTLERKFRQLIAADTEYQNIVKAIRATIEMLHTLREFIVSVMEERPSLYEVAIESVSNLLAEPGFEILFSQNKKDKLNYDTVAECDQIIRFRHRDKMYDVLQFIYQLDVYITVSRVAVERRFIFPKALAKGQNIRLEGVYHPNLKNAVGNSLIMTPEKNIVFLTGANMAGKSTFMKSLGVALYLGHMGFPIAASKMEFSVMDGLYSTINLSDNLNVGASHFYSEVIRLKAMAREISLSKNIFIIIDELFRGTNVKDAFEATVAITGAFARKQSCMFIVSTHIIEAGEVLKKQHPDISFKYLPTQLKMNIPVYTYKLETGITGDRHGMIIINNEGILDILKRGNPNKKQL